MVAPALQNEWVPNWQVEPRLDASVVIGNIGLRFSVGERSRCELVGIGGAVYPGRHTQGPKYTETVQLKRCRNVV